MEGVPVHARAVVIDGRIWDCEARFSLPGALTVEASQRKRRNPDRIRVRLLPDTSGSRVLDGYLVDVVFMGTDTLFSVGLANGEAVTVRRQNSGGDGEHAGDIGRTVGVSWEPQDAWALIE